MSNQGSSYENLYTKQINDAVFDQTGYDSKKEEEKKRIHAEGKAVKRQIRAFGALIFACFLGAAGYLINLDPANAGPCAIALVVFLVVSGIVWFMNK